MTDYTTDYTDDYGEPLPDHDSWEPIDLGPHLRGEVTQAVPSLGIHRSDGLQLLYPGKEHSVIGEMESGKTWFAAACVAAELEMANHVVYVHFEEPDPGDLIGRLHALGISDTAILKLLRFVAPERQVSVESLNRLLDPAPSLVVFDGVNEAMSLHRWGIRDEDGAAAFRRYLVMPCLRVGAGTLACDHVVKSVEARGRYGIGSVHKGNGLSGSLIMLENADPFGRGLCGRSHVFVTKDRPGHLRQHGRPDDTVAGKTYMGELVVDDTQRSTPDLDLHFWAPRHDDTSHQHEDPRDAARRAEKAKADAHVLAAVDAILAAGQDAGVNAIMANCDYGKSKTTESLERLKLDGILTDHRAGQQRLFRRSEQPDYRSGWSGSKDPETTQTGLASPGSPADHPDHPDHFEQDNS
jgi:hypothetical protein